MLMKIAALRICCKLLGFITIIAIWWWVSRRFVYSAFDVGTAVAKAVAGPLGAPFGVKRGVSEALLVNSLGADQTIVLATTALLWFVVLCPLFDRRHVARHVGTLLLAFTLVHIFLAIAWLVWTDQTVVWYDWHKDKLVALVRGLKWELAEDFLRFFKLEKLAVYIEVIAVYAMGLLVLRRYPRQITMAVLTIFTGLALLAAILYTSR